MLALIDSLGWQEMFLLFVIGLLLYGRNLPEAGRKLGIVVAKLKRGFDDFKRQINDDADVQEMKKTLHDTTSGLRKARDVPRKLADPVQAAKSMARDAMRQPVDDGGERDDGEVPPQTADPATADVGDRTRDETTNG